LFLLFTSRENYLFRFKFCLVLTTKILFFIRVINKGLSFCREFVLFYVCFKVFNVYLFVIIIIIIFFSNYYSFFSLFVRAVCVFIVFVVGVNLICF